MAVIAFLVLIVSFVLAALALIGLLRGTAPFLKLKSRGLYAASFMGAFFLLVIGTLLIPKSDVALSVTPTNATVKVNGDVYKGGQTKLNLVANTKYTVEVSAEGYKPQTLEWDTGKQQKLSINLLKKTAADLASEKAALEQQKREEAAAIKRQQQEEAATIKRQQQAAAAAQVVEARKAKELSDGLFTVKCKNLVSSKLKSPSTAKFPGTFEQIDGLTNYTNGNKDWNGWVDSQNSFGAMIRTEFLCEYNLETQKIEITFGN